MLVYQRVQYIEIIQTTITMAWFLGFPASSPTLGKPAAAMRRPMDWASGRSQRRRAAHLARM